MICSVHLYCQLTIEIFFNIVLWVCLCLCSGHVHIHVCVCVCTLVCDNDEKEGVEQWISVWVNDWIVSSKCSLCVANMYMYMCWCACTVLNGSLYKTTNQDLVGVSCSYISFFGINCIRHWTAFARWNYVDRIPEKRHARSIYIWSLCLSIDANGV